MSTATKRPLLEAVEIASHLCRSLAPFCDRIHIAGSIRRLCPNIGDIELVVIPKILRERVDLFHKDSVNQLWKELDRRMQLGTIVPADPPRWGDRYRKFILQPEGIGVDVFSADYGNWGNILLIRTGSADFSKQFMIDLHRFGLTSHEGWIIRRHDQVRIETPSEKDVFAQARRPYLEPEKRSL